MSMFNRAVKIQFNRMKYSDLKSTTPFSERYFVESSEVIWARMFWLSLGIISCAGLINFDINKYKFWKGIMRWMHRVQGLFSGHHHAHEHGLVGDYPGAHSHDHGHGHGHDDHHGKGPDSHHKDSHEEKQAHSH